MGEEAITAVKEGRAPEGLSADEAVVVSYAQELIRNHRVSEATFEAAKGQLGLQGAVDLTATVGYYSMIASVLNAFDVQPAAGVTLLLPV